MYIECSTVIARTFIIMIFIKIKVKLFSHKFVIDYTHLGHKVQKNDLPNVFVL